MPESDFRQFLKDTGADEKYGELVEQEVTITMKAADLIELEGSIVYVVIQLRGAHNPEAREEARRITPLLTEFHHQIFAGLAEHQNRRKGEQQ